MIRIILLAVLLLSVEADVDIDSYSSESKYDSRESECEDDSRDIERKSEYDSNERERRSGQPNEETTDSSSSPEVLVIVNGVCFADDIAVDCSSSPYHECPPGEYLSREDISCIKMCSPLEHFSELEGCLNITCTILSRDDYILVRNTSTEFYADGFLRSRQNDTHQYCSACANIPFNVAKHNLIRGFENKDFITNKTFVCSFLYTELNSYQITDVNSTEMVLYRGLNGNRFALRKAVIVEANLTYFLKSNHHGIICEFIQIPEGAVVASTEKSITVNENTGTSVYEMPLYSKNEDDYHEICVDRTPQINMDTDCRYELTRDVVNFTNGIIIVKETQDSFRIYHEGYFKLSKDNRVFVCQERVYTWWDKHRAKVSFGLYALSICSLIVTVVIFIWVKPLRNVPGVVIINECLAFASSYLFNAFVKTAESNHQACFVVAVCIHFFFLASFIFAEIYAMILVRGIWTGRPSNTDSFRKKIILTASGWLLAAICISISLIIHTYAPLHGPMYASPSCFVNNSFFSLHTYFYGPLITMLGINEVALAIILGKVIASYVRRRDLSAIKKDRQETIKIILIAAKLEVSFGLLWVVALVSVFTQNKVVISLFIVVNSLQGFFLFLIFVCNSRVLGKVKAHVSTMSTSNKLSSGGSKPRENVSAGQSLEMLDTN